MKLTGVMAPWSSFGLNAALKKLFHKLFCKCYVGPVNRIVEDSIADISIDDGRAASNSIAGSVNHSGM